MRIVFVADSEHVPDLQAGGPLATHGLCLALAARGLRPEVAAVTRRPDQAAVVDHDQGYPVHRRATPQAALAAAMASGPIDVMVVVEPGHSPIIAMLERFPPMAVVAYVHSTHGGPDNMTAALRARTVWVANSEYTAGHLRERWSIDAAVVPPLFGVDRLGAIERSGHDILCVGLQRRKGTDIVVRIAEARPMRRFTFVESWTEDAEQSRDLVQRIGRLANARLLPNGTDMAEVYRRTGLVIMASRSREGFGRTITEAQLCGIPALASDRGALPRTVGPGGIVLDPDGAFSCWLDAFDRLTGDAACHPRLADAARAHAADMLDHRPVALDAFVSALQTAKTRVEANRSVVTTRLPVPRRRPLTGLADLGAVAKLAALAPASWLVRQGAWPAVCAYLARIPGTRAARESRIAAPRYARAICCDYDGVPVHRAAHDAIDVAAQRDEVLLQCLRARRPGGWHPTIALEGVERLESARRGGGGGVILWIAHFAFASNIVKVALADAGHPFHQVSRPEHGLTSTELGVRWLNRVRTGFEDRYLAGRLIFDRARPAAALRAARRVLAAEGIVGFTAGDWEGGRLVDAPFMGGRLRLAVGPVRLAALTGATLLPVFGVKTARPDAFTVRIGEPIAIDRDGDAGLISAVEEFLTQSDDMVRRFATQWRGWTSLRDA